MNEEPTNRGVNIRLFGVVLIILGALNSMLSWRGGFALTDTHVLLIVSGIALYAIGAIRRGRGTRTAPQDVERTSRAEL